MKRDRTITLNVTQDQYDQIMKATRLRTQWGAPSSFHHKSAVTKQIINICIDWLEFHDVIDDPNPPVEPQPPPVPKNHPPISRSPTYPPPLSRTQKRRRKRKR